VTKEEAAEKLNAITEMVHMLIGSKGPVQQHLPILRNFRADLEQIHKEYPRPEGEQCLEILDELLGLFPES
jgi:hypothetical protein